ncbi:MAG: CPBP family intramembrane metalloprotease [Clostridia bacterium]|nr:CPBP family intramembrane metalloprotease [Clostridia bacterium]
MKENLNFDFYSFNLPQNEQPSVSEAEPQAPMSAESDAPKASPAAPSFAPPVRPDALHLRRARRAFSRAGWALSVMLFVWYAASTVIQTLAAFLLPSLLEQPWFVFASGSAPLYVFGVPALALVLLGLPKETPQKCRFGAGRFTVALFIALGLAIAGSMVGNTFMAVLGGLSGFEFSNMLETALDMPLPLTVLGMVMLAPVFEELIFRKLLMDRLLPYGELMAIAVTSLMFGLIHGNFYQFFYAAALGALLGYLYVRSGKLWLCVLMHAAVNLLCGVLPNLLMERVDYDKLVSITDETELFSFIFDNFNDVMLLGLYYMLFYSLAAVGIILLLVFFKRLTLQVRRDELPRGWRAGVAFGNAGMIVALLLCAGLFLLNMIATAQPII